jgi:hypothetical protein
MSETKFTPAPWSIRGADTRWVVSPSKTNMPWYVAEVIGGCDHDGSGLDRQNANAHLIAAAPELYEALEQLMTVCTRYGIADFPEIQAEHVAAVLALAKARGELS